MATKPLQIPFSKDNHIPHYVYSYMHGADKNFTWKENFEFDDVMYVNGRSAAYFDVEFEETEYKACMFMTDMTDIIMNHTITEGMVTGKFTFCKRGSNYGVRYLGK